jgi:hypothetical protein
MADSARRPERAGAEALAATLRARAAAVKN